MTQMPGEKVVERVTQAEWGAAVNTLPADRDHDDNHYNKGWNDYRWELVSEGMLMAALIAAANVRADEIERLRSDLKLSALILGDALTNAENWKRRAEAAEAQLSSVRQQALEAKDVQRHPDQQTS